MKKYGVKLSDVWLEKVRLASLRFNAARIRITFVSANGLVMTNHHVATEIMQQLGTPENDIASRKAFTPKRTAKVKAPSLELDQLISQLKMSRHASKPPSEPDQNSADAALARVAAIAAIEKESLEKTGLRSDVVTLYRGAEYHLYRYKKYTDIRLVSAPEVTIGFFGGDRTISPSRADLDVAFFRVRI